MTKNCRSYTLETVSRFIDRELSETEYIEFFLHTKQCEICAGLVKKIQALGPGFELHGTREVEKLKNIRLNLDPGQAAPAPAPWKFGQILSFSKEHLFIKLASIAAITLITTLALFQAMPLKPVNPSAIVKSVDTNYPLVMILETKKEKHTIIWFSET